VHCTYCAASLSPAELYFIGIILKRFLKVTFRSPLVV
jgi:hypothetical protein